MFERYYSELLNYCARAVRGDTEMAAEIVQESCLRVLALQRSGHSIAEPRALLFQMARHVMVDRHRRQQLRNHESLEALSESDLPITSPEQQPEEQAACAQEVEAYLAVIQALPPRCRQAFVLHIYEGLSHAEIASQMGTSVSMVEKHIARARLACRDCQRRMQEGSDQATQHKPRQ